MSSIVVRGDVERICLSADPTCTGVNPCRACWEFVRDAVMPASIRAGNAAATEAQTRAVVREHFMRWMQVVGAGERDAPEVFRKIMKSRKGAMAQEQQDATTLGVQPPLSPFHAVVMQLHQQFQSAQPSSATTGGLEEPPPFEGEEIKKPMGRGDVKEVVKTGSRKRKAVEEVAQATMPELANGVHGEPDDDDQDEQEVMS